MMRTTLDIDDDVLAAAKDLARAEGRTMGHVISELARRALTTPGLHDPASGPTGFGEAQSRFIGAAEPDDFPTFPDRPGPPVTAALIERIEDELDREDAEPFDHAVGQPR